MVTVYDQIERKVTLQWPAKRIVSLVPSQTELLVDLGLKDRMVGVTKFCVHPPNLRHETAQIGGTKKLHLDKIRRLIPDLILANKEENIRDEVEALANDYPVYVSDIESFEDVKSFIDDMGTLTGNENAAREQNELLDKALQSLQTLSTGSKPTRVLYFIWKDPYMVAGTDTFISHTLNYGNALNAIGIWKKKGFRYPRVSIGEINEINPDVLLMSSEPYPFTASHAKEIEDATGIRAIPVDGELFSWYGTRIIHALPQLKNCFLEIHNL